MDYDQLSLSEQFTRTINSVFKERGTLWLQNLPVLLAECAERWELTILPPFSNLSYNYVTPVVRSDGSDAVLKVGVPHKELWSEMEALRVFGGRGSVRLLEADSERGAMLLERLKPGTPLTMFADETQDAYATSIAASVMRKLRHSAPAQHDFPSVADWAGGMKRMRAHFDGGTGPFPAALVEEAENLFTELLASSAPPVLLHGDLHHDNILETENGLWLAIDPKGLIGEPAYEVGALLRNLWPTRHALHNPQQMLERRVHQFAEELEMDRARVRGWGVAQAVLSAWWSVEDGDNGWQETMTVAQWIADVRA